MRDSYFQRRHVPYQICSISIDMKIAIPPIESLIMKISAEEVGNFELLVVDAPINDVIPLNLYLTTEEHNEKAKQQDKQM